MKIIYKNLFLTVLAVFFTIFLASLQISFLNNFNWTFNIFLILILFLVISKNTYSALFFGWLSGFLTDTVSFSYFFGINSLILLILTAFLIIFQKKILIADKTKGILLMGAIAIFFYHFLEWVINRVFISRQEKFSFYFLNTSIAAELILTTLLLLAIFNFMDNFAFDAKSLNITSKKS